MRIIITVIALALMSVPMVVNLVALTIVRGVTTIALIMVFFCCYPLLLLLLC